VVSDGCSICGDFLFTLLGGVMKKAAAWKWVSAEDQSGLFLVDSNDYIILSADNYSIEDLDLIKSAPILKEALSDIVKVLRFYVRHEQKLSTDIQNDLLQSACSALAQAEGWE
jgi:hypothetical protein